MCYRLPSRDSSARLHGACVRDPLGLLGSRFVPFFLAPNCNAGTRARSHVRRGNAGVVLMVRFFTPFGLCGWVGLADAGGRVWSGFELRAVFWGEEIVGWGFDYLGKNRVALEYSSRLTSRCYVRSRR